MYLFMYWIIHITADSLFYLIGRRHINVTTNKIKRAESVFPDRRNLKLRRKLEGFWETPRLWRNSDSRKLHDTQFHNLLVCQLYTLWGNLKFQNVYGSQLSLYRTSLVHNPLSLYLSWDPFIEQILTKVSLFVPCNLDSLWRKIIAMLKNVIIVAE